MALAAGLLDMHRVAQFRFVDIQRPAVFGGFDLPALVATEAIRVRHSLIVKHLPDFVRLMAVHACRQNVQFLLPQLSLDDLAMHRFDLSMAFCAGRGDVLAGDR